jgi:hypothetical protein
MSNGLTFRPSKWGFDVMFRDGGFEPEIRQYRETPIVSSPCALAAERPWSLS